MNGRYAIYYGAARVGEVFKEDYYGLKTLPAPAVFMDMLLLASPGQIAAGLCREPKPDRHSAQSDPKMISVKINRSLHQVNPK